MDAGFKVENSEQLLKLLRSYPDVVKNAAVIKGMEAGADLINESAKAKLFASRKGASKTGYNYYAAAFKKENLKSKAPDTVGIRTGVYNKKEGYKFRWLEWGTAQRFTRTRKNALTGVNTTKKSRGKIIGNNFFFDALKGKEDIFFRTISNVIVKALEDITSKPK